MTIFRQSAIDPYAVYTIDDTIDCRPPFAAALMRFGPRNNRQIFRCLEIGVQRADNAAKMKAALDPDMLFLVDSWRAPSQIYADQSIANQDFDYVCSRFGNDLRVTVIRGDSKIVLPNFMENYFDVVYIDGDHSKDGCTIDIRNSLRVCKVGSILGGHDFGCRPDNQTTNSYVIRNDPAMGGVDSAVAEVFNGLEIWSEASDWWVVVTEEMKRRSKVSVRN